MLTSSDRGPIRIQYSKNPYGKRGGGGGSGLAGLYGGGGVGLSYGMGHAGRGSWDLDVGAPPAAVGCCALTAEWRP